MKESMKKRTFYVVEDTCCADCFTSLSLEDIDEAPTNLKDAKKLQHKMKSEPEGPYFCFGPNIFKIEIKISEV